MKYDFIEKLRIPVVAAPMFLVSGPEVVLASCLSGIVGAFPTHNARPIDVLEDWMGTITRGIAEARAADPDRLIGPWAASVVTHRSNARLAQDLALIEKYRPPLVITALGSPKPALQVVRGYGGVVLADVVDFTLARKAVDAGVDGLACICAGAGGHTGSLSPFAFASGIREFFDGLLVLGGGIADGRAVAGAIAAGADLAYVGTRFIATDESRAPPRYKEMLVDSTVDDLVVSSGLTGAAANWLKQSLIHAGLDPANLPSAPPPSFDMNRPISARKWVDTWSAGQGVGAIKRIAPLADVVDELVRQYRAAMARIGADA